MTKKRSLVKQKAGKQLLAKGDLIEDLRRLIEQSRESIASTINVCMNALYWNIGHRIRLEILGEKRAEYGRSIVAKLSRQLSIDHGNGFSEKSLRKMMQFAKVFPDEQMVASLMRQLCWSHFLILIPVKVIAKRDFYAEMCRA